MDIKTLIQQILNVIKSGYCLAAFILLRKILVDIGYLIFFSTSPIKTTSNEENKFEEDYIKGLEDYISSFTYKWKFASSYKGYILIEEDRKPELKEAKKIRIRDIETFRNTLKKKSLKFKQVEFEYTDKFLMEQLDVIRTFKIDIFTYAKSNRKLKEKDKEIYKEYRKLSEVIHTPIYLNYPPYASLLEYIGFQHHLTKIRKLIEETITTYNKIKR
ncbi:hypothetical protein DRN69_04235 [Candidatus Pacearchaeota archaeon]|nr:MAG: hypothetical protein DRN69_04235 [Candidatus Pacearchaeota archaeon]